MKKIFLILSVMVAILIIIGIGGYLSARYFINKYAGPEYLFIHPTIAKFLNTTPVCPTVCVAGGVCGKDGKNYCNQCVAFQHGAGYTHDGACVPSSWNTLNNDGFGFSLGFPKNFFDTGHEPRILSGDCNYDVFPNQCPNINDIVTKDMIASGGDVNAIRSNLASPNYWDKSNGAKQVINNITYCLYANGDAGMGHVFDYYYYVTVKNNKCLVVNFDTSTSNCDFYLPLEPGNTAQETNYNNCITTNKNQPIILNEIINTFSFKN